MSRVFEKLNLVYLPYRCEIVGVFGYHDDVFHYKNRYRELLGYKKSMFVKI